MEVTKNVWKPPLSSPSCSGNTSLTRSGQACSRFLGTLYLKSYKRTKIWPWDLQNLSNIELVEVRHVRYFISQCPVHETIDTRHHLLYFAMWWQLTATIHHQISNHFIILSLYHFTYDLQKGGGLRDGTGRVWGPQKFKKTIKPSWGSQTTAATGLGLRKLASNTGYR